MSRAVAILLLALSGDGCVSHVVSQVQIDGTPFLANHCQLGQGMGFPGIELADDRGRRLRVAQNLDGTIHVAYFAADNVIGADLGTCGFMSVQRGVGVINGVQNLEGSVTLACQTPQHQVSGPVTFQNCH